MSYRIEVENSETGSDNFTDYQTALLFYSGTIVGLKIREDKTTNVKFLQKQLGEWIVLTDRFDTVKDFTIPIIQV